MAWYPLASAPASAKPMHRENSEFNASGDIWGPSTQQLKLPSLRKIGVAPPQHP
jgi:hypothetical protein